VAAAGTTASRNPSPGTSPETNPGRHLPPDGANKPIKCSPDATFSPQNHLSEKNHAEIYFTANRSGVLDCLRKRGGTVKSGIVCGGVFLLFRGLKDFAETFIKYRLDCV